MVGFVDTLVDVNETDGQATLNVSITHPLPIAELQLMFALLVDSMDGSAGRDGTPMIFHEYVPFYTLITSFFLWKQV